MNKRATYCQKVHYTYISQKQSFKKNWIKMRLIWNASPTRPSQENYYTKRITAENAGADLIWRID